MNELEDKSKEYTEAKAQGGKWRKKLAWKYVGHIHMSNIPITRVSRMRRQRKWNRSNMGFPHYPKVEQIFHKLKWYKMKYQLLWC